MTYQIADEPLETQLAAYVVRPTLPLLAAMLAGAWLAWPWFAFNAIAMGSPTRKKEIALCGAAFAVTAVLAAILIALVRADIIVSFLWIRIALLGIVAFKLTMSYYIATVQARTFAVFEYYGGAPRSGSRALAIGFLARKLVIGLVKGPLWVIVVSGMMGR